MASSERWLESIAANAHNKIDVMLNRFPWFLRESFTCSLARCQSIGSACSPAIFFRQSTIDSVYCIYPFFLDGSICVENIILPEKRDFVSFPLSFD
jgi:hypothetical protein